MKSKILHDVKKFVVMSKIHHDAKKFVIMSKYVMTSISYRTMLCHLKVIADGYTDTYNRQPQ